MSAHAASHGAAGGDDSSPDHTRPPKASWSHWERVTRPRRGAAACPLPALCLALDLRVASPRGPHTPHQQRLAFRDSRWITAFWGRELQCAASGPVQKRQRRANEDEQLNGGEAERREAGAPPDVPGKSP